MVRKKKMIVTAGIGVLINACVGYYLMILNDEYKMAITS